MGILNDKIEKAELQIGKFNATMLNWKYTTTFF